MDALLNFDTKVVLITGAAQGLGKLLAEELAKRGAKLVISDINEQGINDVANTLSSAGFDVIGQVCNVADSEQCKSIVDLAITTYGRLDIAVNNAGIAPAFAPLHLTDEATMDKQFSVNVKGVQFGMRHQIQQMLNQDGGVILNVSSMAGLGGAPTIASYAAAKHAVIGLTKTGAIEYARNNIRVNAICPFFTLTPMVTTVSDDESRKNLARGCPMKRLAQPHEIVNAMVLMLSPGNSYMNGQCIAIDGGVSA